MFIMLYFCFVSIVVIIELFMLLDIVIIIWVLLGGLVNLREFSLVLCGIVGFLGMII